MSPAFATHVASFQVMPPEQLDQVIVKLELAMRQQQTMLAAAKKARKNQRGGRIAPKPRR